MLAGVCQLAQDPGTCYDWVIKWYYDAERAVCRRFYYGSCEGNGNRFDTEEACQQTCLKPTDNEETETEGDGSDTPPEKGIDVTRLWFLLFHLHIVSLRIILLE